MGLRQGSSFRAEQKKKASEPEGPEAVIPVISLVALLYGDAVFDHRLELLGDTRLERVRHQMNRPFPEPG